VSLGVGLEALGLVLGVGLKSLASLREVSGDFSHGLG